MLRIQTILCPTDFSACAGEALPYALDLARRHEAELHLLNVAPTFGDDPLRGAYEAMIDDDAFNRRLHDASEERMQAVLAAQDTSGVLVRTVHMRGSAPGGVITEYAAANDTDLIVLGTHGRRGLRKMLLGSVAQEVLHRSGCPVLMVHGNGTPRPSALVSRILVPIDFSVHSVNALAYARQLAALYGAALDVLHVIDPMLNEPLQTVGWKYRKETMREVGTSAQEKLEWLSNEVRGPEPIEMERHLLMGYPPAQIVDFAKDSGADLIVIASHGLSGYQRFPLGSVTERVVRAAPCPVFITRPFSKSLLPHPERTTLEEEPVKGEPFEADEARPEVA